MSEETKETTTAAPVESTASAVESKPGNSVKSLFSLLGSPEAHPLEAAIEQNAVEAVTEKPARRSKSAAESQFEPDGVEMTPEEIVNQFLPSAPKQDEAEPEATAPDDDEAFNSFLSTLNELAGQALGPLAVAAPEPQASPPAPQQQAPAAPPAPAIPVSTNPTAAMSFADELDEDKLYELVTSPEAFRRYVASVGERAQQQTMQTMQTAMYKAATDAIHANKFEEEVCVRYPGIVEKAPNLVIAAYRQAKEQMPYAPYDELKSAVFSKIDIVWSKYGAIEKTAKTPKDMRGIMAPKSASRSTPGLPGKAHKDAGEEQFDRMMEDQSRRGSRLLQIIGA